MHRAPKTVPAEKNQIKSRQKRIRYVHRLTAILDSFARIFNLKNTAIGRIRGAVEIVPGADAAHLKIKSRSKSGIVYSKSGCNRGRCEVQRRRGWLGEGGGGGGGGQRCVATMGDAMSPL
jgi:hypothetical protein